MTSELRQQGFVLMLMLLLLAVGGAALVFSYYRPASLALANDRKAADTLALVKAALIGWTVKRGNACTTYAGGWVTCTGNDRPGELPCPDRNNDGFDNDGNCAAGELGRVPWKTLGIPEPRDSAGETLWYAVAGPFRTRASNNNIINSDTRGNMTVFAADGTTVLTSQAVAVIIAPGQTLGSQARSGGDQNVAANYLETGPNGVDNATNNGPFINGRASSAFNDRLIYLTAPEFIPAVEKRVAAEVNAWLDGYRAASICQCYPWAADFNIDTGSAANHDYHTPSVVGMNRGRFPVGTAQPEMWGGSTPALSAWFTYNNWNTAIYYAVAKQNAQGQGTLCTTCMGMTLNVDGKNVISALFFMPGTPLGIIARPSNAIADYLEDAANNDGADDTYTTPSMTTAGHDHIYTSISAPAAPDTFQQCHPMGKALRKLAPCGQPSGLNPQCARLAGVDLSGNLLPPPATGLATCSAACAAAALVLVNVPCQNSLRPSVCKSAYKTLDHCD